jgi:hypothetical protein
LRPADVRKSLKAGPEVPTMLRNDWAPVPGRVSQKPDGTGCVMVDQLGSSCGEARRARIHG